MLDRPPLAQIDIYRECIILTRRRPDGTWTSYPISPDALSQTLGRLPVSSGLLPSGVLASGQYQGKSFFVQLIRPRLATLPIEDGGKLLTVRIQTPPLIWAGWDRDYRIWAIKHTDPDGTPAPESMLFVAPFPNVYESGAICWGSAERPRPAAPDQLGPALRLFLEGSRFNNHIAGGKSVCQPASVLRLYDKLNPDEPYPLNDLVASRVRLDQVLSGRVWGARW